MRTFSAKDIRPCRTPLGYVPIVVKGDVKMIVLVEANVLTVGLNGKSQALCELPIRIVNLQSGRAAVRSLKTEKMDSIISRWDLEDMKDGQFIRSLKKVKPDIPTIVFIKSGNRRQEVEARSLGVSAVLTDEISDELFRETVANILGIEPITIKAIGTVGHIAKTAVPQNVHE